MNPQQPRILTESASTCILEASSSTEQKCPADPQSTRPFPKLGSYTILSAIGRGASSVVYSALENRTQHRVALKQLRAGMDQNSTLIRDFLHEGRLLMGVRHPHIIRCHDFFFESGSYWIVLDEVTGGSLKERSSVGIKASEMPVVHKWLDQITDAVKYIHARKIVHRDIKPANILIHDHRAILADFGLACQISGHHLRSDCICGTPDYMSSSAKQGGISPENDWYALRETFRRLGVPSAGV